MSTEPMRRSFTAAIERGEGWATAVGAFLGFTICLGLGLAVACVSVVLYYVSPEKLALPPGGSVASRALLPNTLLRH